VVVVRSAFGEKQTAQAGDCHEFAVSSRKNVDVAGCSRVDDADKVGDRGAMYVCYYRCILSHSRGLTLTC
jgi:hypothetical protein